MISWIFLQNIGAAGSKTDSALADTLASGLVTPTGTPVAPPEEATLSLFELVMKGGVVMIPIALLSLLTVYVLIERIIAIRRASRYDRNFMNNIRDFIKTGNMDAARTLCKSSESPQARIIGKGISRVGKPIRDIEVAMENEAKLELYNVEKNLSILSIVGRIAPMLGFIGTILGVIHIFYEISLQDSISIGVISNGLYQKMITSAGGLIVGVIAFVAYHWLSIVVDKIVHRMEDSAAELVDILQEPGK